MKRSIFLLTVALAIFVLTLAVSNNYIRKEALKDAYRINELLAADVRNDMDHILARNQRAVHSFLSGLFDYEIIENKEWKDTLISASRDDIEYLKKDVYDNLKDFITINPSVNSAMFIIEPSKDFGDGKSYFAPIVYHDSLKQENLSHRISPQTSKSYSLVKKTGCCMWRVPSQTSPVYGKVLIYYVPIYYESGAFFGVFSISLSIEHLRQRATNHLPYDKFNSSITLIDEQGNNLFSTSSDLTSISEDADIIHRSNLKHAPWQTVTISSKDKVYSDVRRTHRVYIVVSSIGLLLMLICFYVILQQIKQHIRQKTVVEEELKIASRVQKAMLKSTKNLKLTSNNKISAFMQPAKQVGGDLYDFMEKDGSLIFCIGDVSGKGIPAALFMTQVISLFRDAVRRTSVPEEIVSQINDILSQDNPDMTFCTFFVGKLNGSTLTFCNAGHNAPVIQTKCDNRFTAQYMKVKPNVALGMMENYPYKSETITLSANESILLYTDGVTEAMNVNHKFFGEERLLEVLSQHHDASIDDVLRSVRSFVGNNEQSDDITMVQVN